MAGYIGSKAVNLSTTGADINGDANIDGTITSDGLTVNSGAANTVALFQSTDSVASIYLVDGNTTGGSSASQGLITTGNNLAVRAVNNVIIETGTTDRLRVDNNGDISFYEDTGTTAKLFWDASAESLGIGKTDRTNVSVLTVQNVSDVSTNTAEFYNDNGNRTFRFAQDTSGNADLLLEKDDGTDTVLISTHGDSYFNGGNVGIGVVPETWNSANNGLQVGPRAAIFGTDSGYSGFSNNQYQATDGSAKYIVTAPAAIINLDPDSTIKFRQAASGTADTAISWSEAMRIDSSGRLLVGTTNADPITANADGVSIGTDKIYRATVTGGPPIALSRKGNDGSILACYRDTTFVGSIGVTNTIGISNTYIAGTLTGLSFANASIFPTNQSGAVADNSKDLGYGSGRFDDIYATNATIQTSDRNEKQDIAELTDSEQRVAVAAKGLLRKFRWKDAVAEKGDEARTHFGIIAQDLQAAFAAEGLDAGDYAMFISSTWTDEETGEERTRMGVRYSELLAFIIGAL